MKNKKNPILFVGVLVITLIFAVIGIYIVKKYTPSKKQMDLNEYFGTATDQDAHIIIRTQKLDSKGIIENGTAYVPLDVVQEYLNERFYFDVDYDRILYATPSEITTAAISDKSGSEAIRKNDLVYLSLDYVKKYTNLEAVLLENPSRIVIQEKFSDLNAVKTTKEAAIRYQGGIKSDILTIVPEGTELMLLEELDKWDKVATFDGYTGYLEKKKVSDPYTYEKDTGFKMEQYTYNTMDETVVLGWHLMGVPEENDHLETLIQNTSGMNVISPTWFFLADNFGNLIDQSSAEYVEYAHEKGLQVWGLVNNIDGPGMILEVLSHTDSRTNLIHQLVQRALDLGLDGINIDFEALKEETIVHLNEFLREMKIECQKNHLILSIDDPVPEGYTGYYNRREQGKVVDYVIIMGYDEHYYGGDEIGSVASLSWVEQGIQDTLEEVPAHRVINAMPFYTRLWQTQNGVILDCEAYGMDSSAEIAAKHKNETKWDEKAGQNVTSYEENGIEYKIWHEDADSIAEKTKLVKKYKLAGVAAWRLGLENSEIWKTITDNLK